LVILMDRIKRISLMALLMGVIALGLSACGGDTATATPPPQPTDTAVAALPTQPADAATATTGGSGSTGDEQVVNITLQEFSITPADVTVNAGKVKFVVTNKGSLSHNFTVTDSSGVLAATATFGTSDGPQTLELDLKAGTYPTLCSVPGHAQHGQKGTITVK
jgi:plastocyanin